MPRALVTGASGFAGPYLIRHLMSEGYEVVGGVYGPEGEVPDGCHIKLLDIIRKEAVRRIIAEVAPDEVYHLAGLTRPAIGKLDEYYRVNFGGVLNLLEAVREHAPESKILLVGSAYAYGQIDHRVTESDLLEPVNHYGVSKAAADLLGCSYAVEGLRVVRVRPFNHSGPGQSPDFVLPVLVRQFVEILTGYREPIVRLGNVDSVRDLSDVRDVVRGYRLALSKGRSGEVYNLGSGQGISIRNLFELVSREAGVEVELVTEPSRKRTMDISYLVADATKAHQELGWETEIPLRKTVLDMLEAALEDRRVAETGDRP